MVLPALFDISFRLSVELAETSFAGMLGAWVALSLVLSLLSVLFLVMLQDFVETFRLRSSSALSLAFEVEVELCC